LARFGVFGWGIVAPKSPTIDAFAKNLESAESWLAPFNGFGPDCFLVGTPEFEFEDYKDWIVERFSPNRYRQLKEKMDLTTCYAIGAFVQALGQNPGIETTLQELGSGAHIYVGTGLGAIPTHYDQALNLYWAQRRWNRFWADPERNAPLREFLASSEKDWADTSDVPQNPSKLEGEERHEAEDAWWSYWAARSPELAEYLREVREIELVNIEGNIEKAKLAAIREKRRRHARLQDKWAAPDPPWNVVSGNVIWNIANTPASQLSMLGRITGVTFAPVAACSTFGVTLKLAMDAIRRGEAKAVVIGAADPPPHPLIVGAFYDARVISADAHVSKPLTGLRGTHVSGGAVIWIVGDYEYMSKRGYRPLGMEPIVAQVTADAHHIITPSREGPSLALKAALGKADVVAEEVTSWDLHATATPGDYMEVETLRAAIPESVLVTARKGTFGHGMGAGGGWELTAQYLGGERGLVYPTTLGRTELNEEIAKVHKRFVFDEAQPEPAGVAGKMSMGIGGVNACILSRPWKTK
jgi:3-oxoacyl-[acyl-carrier-protein] synthase II